MCLRPIAYVSYAIHVNVQEIANTITENPHLQEIAACLTDLQEWGQQQQLVMPP